MAQTTQSNDTKKSASTSTGKIPLAKPPANGKTTTTSAKTETTAKTTSTSAAKPGTSSVGNFLQRIGLAPRATNRDGTVRKGSDIWRFLVGMLIFVVGSQVAAYVLLFFDNQFKLGLNTIVVFPSNIPLVGGMTLFLILYLAVVILIWVALYRFNIIPKDPFGTKARAAAASAARQGTSGGVRKSRAERRAAAAPKEALATKRVATVSYGDEASDEAYDRVKAAQRQRRRRASKR